MAAVFVREAIYLWYYTEQLLRQILPYWALGIAFGSMVSVFLKNHIHQAMQGLQQQSVGLVGILLASALGILSPLCLYGTVPIVAAFARGGMREDWIAAFMMSSVLLNPQLFLYSLALGAPVACLRLVACFAGGCLAGVAVRLGCGKKPFYRFDAFGESENRDIDPNPWLRLLNNIGRNVRATGGYFLLGIGLTVLYQRYIPSRWVVGLFGAERGLGTLMAAALGIPLYACGGGTIPLLAVWLEEGMPVGSALAFMIAGPATKITNLGAMKAVMGSRSFLVYLLFSVLLATVLGLIANGLFSPY